MSADDLVAITEADVVPGADFHRHTADTPFKSATVLAVANGCVMYRYWYSTQPYVATVSDFINLQRFRKRAPKPPRHTVELRPPKAGERYVNGALLATPHRDFPTTDPRWVIVDDEADQ